MTTQAYQQLMALIGVICTIFGIAIIPFVKWCISVVVILTEIKDGQKAFRTEFDIHVQQDAAQFDELKLDAAQSRRESAEVKGSLGSLKTQVRSVQDKLGVAKEH